MKKITNSVGSYVPTVVPAEPTSTPEPTPEPLVTLDETDLDQRSGLLEKRLRGLLSQAQELGRKTLKTYWEIGEVLIELKAKAGHGNWEDYVKKTFEMSPKTASNYARLVKGYGNIEALEKTFENPMVGDFGLVKALKLLKKNSDEPSQNSADEGDSAFILADGSSISPKKADWKEGFIQTGSLRATMKACEKDEQGNAVPENEAALVQRIVTLIAAAVNKAVGRAPTEKSQKVALEALEIVKTKLVQAGK